MQELLNEVRKADLLDKEFSHAVKEFELAAQAQDEDRMETARLKVHELTDMKLDGLRRVYKLKDQHLVNMLSKIQGMMK